MFRSARRSLGFTLLELLVVIAVISLVILVVIPNVRNLRDEINLKNAVAELQTNLRSTQNNAATGALCQSNNMPAVDWHMEVIDPANYKIEPTCLNAASLPSKNYDLSAYQVVFDTINGCESVDGSKVSFNNISQSASLIPPEGCSASGQINIVLRSNNSNIDPVTLIVEEGGRIYVNN